VFGPYKPTVEGFTYELAADTYRCWADKFLPFRTTENETCVKQYRAAYQDCQQCPLKASCMPHSQFKQVIPSALDAAYRRAWQAFTILAAQVNQAVWQACSCFIFPTYLYRHVVITEKSGRYIG
jgi:hypothetical protein